MRWTRDEYEIDDDRARIDMERVVAWLAESYWAGTQPEAAVRRSWDAAGVTLGLYHGEAMVGCARAVTDFTRFAYLSDVYVEPEHRGRGLGRWLVETIIGHPQIGPVRWVLHTKDAHGLYEQLGFEAADETVMQRPRPAHAPQPEPFSSADPTTSPDSVSNIVTSSGSVS
jgi:GNAT superfamily N-acetyltransferase